MSEIPELRKNQIGVTCKTHMGLSAKMEEEILYFTINKDSIVLELYPKKPIIIIDRDAIKMVLNKIMESEIPTIDQVLANSNQ